MWLFQHVHLCYLFFPGDIYLSLIIKVSKSFLYLLLVALVSVMVYVFAWPFSRLHDLEKKKEKWKKGKREESKKAERKPVHQGLDNVIWYLSTDLYKVLAWSTWIKLLWYIREKRQYDIELFWSLDMILVGVSLFEWEFDMVVYVCLQNSLSLCT